MKTLQFITVPHNYKVGDDCGHIEPNIIEDTLFVGDDGKPLGFYIKKMPDDMCKLADFANHELMSARVPKTDMRRSSGQFNAEHEVKQYSTILGGVPPKPNMRRNYATVSSVHGVKTAEDFIRAMLLLCHKSEELVLSLMPEVYDFQRAEIAAKCPKEYRFGNLFTSSISNANIAAPFHRDGGNLVGCVNVIIAKKHKATGGNTTVPDYGATVDSCDNSMLVYPAWRNLHGVTPIVKTGIGGYRNSLVFYPLKLFEKFV